MASTQRGVRGDSGVDPTHYLHPQTLARLGTLELRAKMIVEGVTSGMHRSPYHGFSVEFAQHRPYVAGDDLRHLDWKLLGRSDKLYLKQYEQETSLDLVLLVDASGSMDFGTRTYASASGIGKGTGPKGQHHWTKYDHATACAAAMAYMALQQRDRVGLGIFADDFIAAIERSSSQGQWKRIVHALSAHPVQRETDFTRMVEQTLAKMRSRCLIGIVSDFFSDLESIRNALARIKHKRHDVILFQVLDHEEQAFTMTTAAPFEGLEGEGRLRLDPRAIREGYLEAFNRHQEGLAKIVRSFGFDLQVVPTHSWLGPPIAAFMAKRSAMLRRRSQS